MVSITCPVCGAPIRAQVYNLVDVDLEPELKSKLLRGRINVTRCTNCGREGVIAAPMLYHDPDKELLLAFVPPEAQLSDEEQQRIIGSLTNLVMSYLPPEKKKGYLLVPKVLLSYQSLLESILRAEGVTSEMMAAQRARMDLLERLLQAMVDEERLRALVGEADEQLDFEFFAVLGAYVEASRQDGLEDRARALEALRERLLEMSAYGRKLAAQVLARPADHPPLPREELLEKMLEATTEEELAQLVAWYRSAVDYLFFQALTEHMDQAGEEGRQEDAQRLRDLRETLLDLTEQLDAEAQVALEQASELLRQLLEAEDPEAVVREHLTEFDDAFFIVLGANLQAAERAGEEQAYGRLQELGNLVLDIARERLPPEVRLIQHLLAAPDGAAVSDLLEEYESLVDERLVMLIRDLAGDIDEEETAARLLEVAGSVERWLQEHS